MKLRIIGNNGPYPAEGGACSSYLLSDDSDKTHILIDCGSGALRTLPKLISWQEIDAVVLSHLHFDHMSDLLPMQYALQFHPRTPLSVYAPETPKGTRALLECPFYELRPMKRAQIGEMTLDFLPVRHPVETYAVRVCCDGKTFVYTGDTNDVAALDAFAENADLLLADAGLSDADWQENKPHMSASGCGKLAARCGAKALLLTHLNPVYSAEALTAEAQVFYKNARFTQIDAEYLI